MDFWLTANVVVNAMVVGGGLTILLSPLAKRVLRNGQTPLLWLLRVIVFALVVQAGLRIWIEALHSDSQAQEALRIVIGLTSMAVIIAVANFLWDIIQDALRHADEGEET